MSRRAIIQRNVNLFFQRRDHCLEETVFNKHQENGLVPLENFPSALLELGLFWMEDEVERVFHAMDLDSTNGLLLDEFKRAIETPSKLDQWCETICLGQLLACCLVVQVDDPLRSVSVLNSHEVDDAFEPFVEGVKKLVIEHQLKLRRSFEVLDQRSKDKNNGASEKFTTFQMKCGGTDDFHKGIRERIGIPNPKMESGMKAEHCSQACSKVEFATDNYNVTTSPHKEYDVAKGTSECPEKDKLDKTGKTVRMLPKLEALKELKLSKEAKLEDFEILAVVLYSGPMFQVYNLILRQFPQEKYTIYKSKDNLFTTTIHVLVSAVTKIARVMRLPMGLKLFRGLGGLAEPPDFFWKPDHFGCRGFMEWGFLSTTSDKATAIQYSGVREGRPHAILLEMTMGSIDRGANISEYSQYPQEREFLWVPCSFLEPTGGTIIEMVPEGVVSVIPVRINANLKTLTVDQILSQRRDLHIATFRNAIDELRFKLCSRAPVAVKRFDNDLTQERNGLEHTVMGLIDEKLSRCKQVLQVHLNKTNEDYHNDSDFRELVVEMLDSIQGAWSALQHYIADPSTEIQRSYRLTLKSARRYYVAFLSRTLPVADGKRRTRAVQALCRVTGMFDSTVDEKDLDGHTRIMSAGADGMGSSKLQLLVAAGANIHEADTIGRTPLYLAACFGHEHTVTALHELNADVNTADNKGYTPLWAAADNGHFRAVEVLCKLGAKVNLDGKDQRGPLHAAAQKGYAKVVKLLCKLGAEVHYKSEFGTPLKLACEKHYYIVAEVLRLHGATQ